METYKKLLKITSFKSVLVLSISAITIHVLSAIFDLGQDIRPLITFVQIFFLVFTAVLCIGLIDEQEPDELEELDMLDIEHLSTDEILRLSELFDGRRIGNYKKSWGREKIVQEFKKDLAWHQSKFLTND